MRRNWTRRILALAIAATALAACSPADPEHGLDAELEELEDDIAVGLDEVEREIEGDLAGALGAASDIARHRDRDRETIDRLGDHLDALHELEISGVLAELDLGSRRVLARRGVAQRGVPGPVPWNARFRMGSLTKTFVAVVVLQLVGEGRLGLDDTLETWLPGLVTGNGYDGSRITIRQLLQHTSGIVNYTSLLFSNATPEQYFERRFQHAEPRELVELALTQPPDFAPGTSWSYSNTGYLLAGMIIQEATGRPWQDEVRDRITRPLAMRDTYEPGDDPDLRRPHAHGYEQFAPDGPFIDVTLQNHTWADAAGSLVTTTRDASRFLRALQRGWLLGPEEMAEMRTTVPAVTLEPVMPGLRYGLGIMQFPTRCSQTFWSHFGDTFGFSTRTAISEDARRVVVVSLSSNRAGEAALDVLGENLALLEDAMCTGL